MFIRACAVRRNVTLHCSAATSTSSPTHTILNSRFERLSYCTYNIIMSTFHLINKFLVVLQKLTNSMCCLINYPQLIESLISHRLLHTRYLLLEKGVCVLLNIFRGRCSSTDNEKSLKRVKEGYKTTGKVLRSHTPLE